MTHLGQKITPMAVLHNKALWYLAFLYSGKFYNKEINVPFKKVRLRENSCLLGFARVAGFARSIKTNRFLYVSWGASAAMATQSEKKNVTLCHLRHILRQSLWFVEQLPPSRRRGCTSAGRAGVLREVWLRRRVCRLERNSGVEIKGRVPPSHGQGAGEVLELTQHLSSMYVHLLGLKSANKQKICCFFSFLFL